jgi:hypothetical protein
MEAVRAGKEQPSPEQVRPLFLVTFLFYLPFFSSDCYVRRQAAATATRGGSEEVRMAPPWSLSPARALTRG